MKGSETITIKRSQINLNPCNPKRHTDAQIKQQKANLKKVGYLGGMVWNEESGNLVDGHRRLQALDLINKYDGTAETDYEVKVEAVRFDDKTEKEQLTYMSLGNSKADYNLVAEYIDQMDYENIGISEEEYNAILELHDSVGESTIETMEDGLVNTPMETLQVREETTDEIMRQHEEKPKMTKEQVKAEKQFCDKVASDRQGMMDLYIVVKFSCVEEKEAFCDMNNLVCSSNMTIDGVTLMDKMDN